MRLIDLQEIKRILPELDLIGPLESGFAAYSRGEAVVPPVGELLLAEPPGEVHIKYGYLKGDDYYVVKIASGFYQNPQKGLPSGNGLMLLFCRKTGALRSVLLDEGHLTDVRTAVAGAIAAKHLAPREIRSIGIIGTGIQARLQLRYLRLVTDCRKVVVFGRSPNKAERYRADLEMEGFSIDTTCNPGDVASQCNLIVTATVSTSPLLWQAQIRPGTHITAVGADAAYKQELDPTILQKADVVVADSISQCSERGEIAHALRAGLLAPERLLELGQIIAGVKQGRSDESQITVADLTGVAVQDIAIAKAVFEALPKASAAHPIKHENA
jgi:ornithine cyclodeaminase